MKLNEIFRYNLTIYKLKIIFLFLSSFFYFTSSVPEWIYFSIFFMYFVYGGLGITTMFHKCLTHGSYKTYKFIERLFSLFGTLSGTGSSIAWVAMHVEHHKFSDTENDPHSPKNGGIRIFLSNYNIDSKKINGPSKRLLRDKFHLFLHNYYLIIHLSWASFLFLLFGVDALFGFYIIPAALTMLMSYFIIYFCHSKIFGYQNFDANDDSKNNLFAGYFIFGEGWHNNHHKYPKKSNYKEKWWEFDLSYYIIKLIKID